jgi:DNA-binding transcriptional LysR family regulator
LEPTALAVELEPNIRSAVESLSGALKGPDEFDPNNSQHTFRLGAAYDLEMLTIIPPLIERVKKNAPRVTLSAGSIPRLDTLRKLNSTELDVALGYYWDEMRHLKSEPLFRQNYKLVMRRGHPLVSGAVSLTQYCDADHLVVSQALDFKGIVDSTLAKLNQKRSVSAVVSSFASGFLTLERSDMVATVPERIAVSLAEKFNLHVTSPPIDIRTFTVSMITHERNEKNPAINWLVEQIRAVCASGS